MRNKFYALLSVLVLLFLSGQLFAQDEMWDKSAASKEHPNIQWFKDAKFGMFIHWGLYSKLGGVWKGKRYYGSGEWIMNQAKIPAADYAAVANEFNPVKFNADEWAQLAKDAGIKYMVITAKHHEGFAMYNSAASDFNIVKATPFKKDPMKLLSEAARKRNIQFGFYYSQFIDWHEPNGGKNTWDFDETKKDYQRYYREKAYPQLRELLSNYGPLGLVWFDMPGGLTKAQTKLLVDSMHMLQPNSLFSSRVGQGLGDYRDFGDSEMPPVPVAGAWESIYTHNDSWGYITHDMNFKSSTEIIQLLASVASKGGNLMLNVGPDGEGNIPPYSIKYLRETGKWLQANGESIYGSTAGFVPPQPWGVTTSKQNKLFIHIFSRPYDGRLLVPGFTPKALKVYTPAGKNALPFTQQGKDLIVHYPASESMADDVIVVEYAGSKPNYDTTLPVTISAKYAVCNLEAAYAKTFASARINSITYSHYFGDWKHANCVTGMQSPEDSAIFTVRITEPGDYKIVLDYNCNAESSKQEAVLHCAGQSLLLRTLRTSEIEKGAPVVFMKHAIGVLTVDKPGVYPLTIHALQAGKELFKLRTIFFESVQ